MTETPCLSDNSFSLADPSLLCVDENASDRELVEHIMNLHMRECIATTWRFAADFLRLPCLAGF